MSRAERIAEINKRASQKGVVPDTLLRPIIPNWMKLVNGWYWVVINKNASTSIKEHRLGMSWYRPTGKDRTVAVIRNPFDRLVSCWANKQKDFPVDTFEDFIEHCSITDDEHINSHARSQYVVLDPWPTKIFLMENVNEGFAEIGIKLRVHNASNRKTWEEYYTPELYEKAAERYKEDLALYEMLKEEYGIS